MAKKKTLQKIIREWNKSEGLILACYVIENTMRENYTENLTLYDNFEVIDLVYEGYRDLIRNKRINMMNNIIEDLDIDSHFKYVLKEAIWEYGDTVAYFNEVYETKPVKYLIDYWIARENHESLELYTDKEIDELYDKWIEARRKIISDKDYNISMEKLSNEIKQNEIIEDDNEEEELDINDLFNKLFG